MVLLIGYGNPGRGDDGLGPALAERIRQHDLPNVEVQIDYQLTVEHALVVAQSDIVVFVDALMDGSRPFEMRPVVGTSASDLGSHALSPDAIMSLAEHVFSATPQGYTLGISGVEFGRIEEEMSGEAKKNLGLAEAFLLDWLKNQPD